MAKLIVEVKNKRKVADLKKFGTITHVSGFIDALTMEAHPSQIQKIKKNSNVISVREGKIGNYQV